jgi:DNA-binding NtrC family response regulator
MEDTPLIMIIDDQTSLLAMFKEVLELNGYRVICFNTFNPALKLYKEKQNEVTAILLDMRLTETDYTETLPALLNVNPEAKIICMSGDVTLVNLPENLRPKIQAFLAKPFDFKVLLEVMKRL